MPPKAKGKQVVVTVPQYVLPAAPPAPAPIALKARARQCRLTASNYGVTVVRPTEGTIEFIPRCGVTRDQTEDLTSLRPLSKEQAVLSLTTTAHNADPKRSPRADDTNAPAKAKGGNSGKSITLATPRSAGNPLDPFPGPGMEMNPVAAKKGKAVKHYAAAGGSTPYCLVATADGHLLEAGSLEDGGDLAPLTSVLTKEDGEALRKNNAAARAAEQQAAIAAAAAGAGPTMRRAGMLASLPAKNPFRNNAAASKGSPQNSAGASLDSSQHGNILSLACGSMHAVWVTVPPGSGTSKVFGSGCVEDYALSLSAARAGSVIDMTADNQVLELQCFADEGITQVWASDSVTFAKGRRGLFALGKLGDRIEWQEPCLIVPALVNQVSPLSPVEEALSIGIGSNACYILMSNGDILVLEETPCASPNTANVSSATQDATSTIPQWQIRNVTYELFPRQRRTKSGAALKESTPPRAHSLRAMPAHGTGKKLREIYAGKAHFLTVDLNDGTVYGWGQNSFGQLGATSVLGLEVPKAIALDMNAYFNPAQDSNIPGPSSKMLVPPLPKVTKRPVPEAMPIPMPTLEQSQTNTARMSSSTKTTSRGKRRGSEAAPAPAVEVETRPPTAEVVEEKPELLSAVAVTCSSWATIISVSDGSLRAIGNF